MAEAVAVASGDVTVAESVAVASGDGTVAESAASPQPGESFL